MGCTTVVCGIKAVRTTSYLTLMLFSTILYSSALNHCHWFSQLDHFQELAEPTVNEPKCGFIGKKRAGWHLPFSTCKWTSCVFQFQTWIFYPCVRQCSSRDPLLNKLKSWAGWCWMFWPSKVLLKLSLCLRTQFTKLWHRRDCATIPYICRPLVTFHDKDDCEALLGSGSLQNTREPIHSTLANIWREK